MPENVIPQPGSWGASPDEWLHFSLFLGLSEDLLPVVSNPNAEKSSDSKLQGPGKTPSRYNRDGKMVGIAKWTDKKTESDEIDKWAKQPDYGICVQTRAVRALDVDVDDETESEEINEHIREHLSTTLPMRFRGNSSKFLLAFHMTGDFTKRRLKTPNGVIEFLANGQQFVAVGTHTSGVRYEWAGGLPQTIPTLDVVEFEVLWQSLEKAFGIEETVEARKGVVPFQKRDVSDTKDDMVSFLADNWEVFGVDKRTGRVDIRCPFEGEHTTESGESATSYFPAGVGGFEQGHFRCQHSHCQHRNDGDFIEAIGYIKSDFDVVVVAGTTPAEAEYPKFKGRKNGIIPSTLDNVARGLASATYAEAHIGFDEFKDELMIANYEPGVEEGAIPGWRPFTDADYTRLRIKFSQKNFKEIGKETMRDAVGMVGDEHKFDSAILWLHSIESKWDGVPRIEQFYPRYFGVDRSEYAEACGLYTWSALAGRVLSPGCKADMAPILVGAQGAGKSSAISSISPHIDFFAELDLDMKDDDIARKLRGKLVCELGELRGMNVRESNDIKAFISRTHEEWVPKYKEFSTMFPRRCLLIGSTNHPEFLNDETGARRYLPLTVGKIDRDAIVRDRDQLWAEGAHLFRKHGVVFHKAEKLAGNVHADHTVQDSWTPIIEEWLYSSEFGEQSPVAAGKTKTHDILQGALRIQPQGFNTGSDKRVCKIMRSLGYVNRPTSTGRRWIRPE